MFNFDRIKEVQSYKEDWLYDKVEQNSDNQILSLVFIPNPKTGRPDSTLSLMLSDKERPQVREFIQQNLFRPASRQGFDNPDDAINMCGDVHDQIGSETDAFKDRIINFVNELRSQKD